MGCLASIAETLEPWSVLGTAMGTLGLAVATVILAVKTGNLSATSQDELALLREQANAANRQSAAAEGALRASVKPLLVSVPPNTLQERRRFGLRGLMGTGVDDVEKIDVSEVRQLWRLEDDDGREAAIRVSVPVRNVGAGVALVGQSRFFAPDGEDEVVIGSGLTSMAVGDIGYITFRLWPKDYAWQAIRRCYEARLPFSVTVDYTDVGRLQKSRTHLLLSCSTRPVYESVTSSIED